ncbi:hypothetical protein FB567DRAFT_296580 [Paraphoma chrysanthemicola]|uniref:Uncharacterized protein n=1 Tax=Paraphoma chrysanthemicola TaxID=798071 RepID=A0A8K0RBG3_9PLEO|nr:hypothetical protein FB567DRAFT_296580 [Paraphoma chrysanthemicola]
MENPENEWQQGWKPNNRPQSTVARNFMTELDSLFKLDGDLDDLDKNVHQKKQAVSTQTQELEALERRLREAEDRLKEAKTNSPPRRKDSSRRSPLEGVFPAQDKARVNGPASPLAQRNAQAMGTAAGARSGTPSSHTSADYVLVERPNSSQRVEA